MTQEHPSSPQADPASHEPSEVPPETCATAGIPRQGDPTDRYMLKLERLTDLGMALTEDLVADAREAIAARRAVRVAALAAAPPSDPAAVPATELDQPEPTPEELAARDPSGLAFARLTRALRLCMALAVRLYNDRQDRENGMVKERVATTERLKSQVEKRVKEIIEVEVERSERGEAKQALRERLEEKDIEIDLRTTPVEEIADRICQDLGIWGDDEDQVEEDEPPARSIPCEYRLTDHPTNPNIVMRELILPEHPPERRRWDRWKKRPSD